MVEITCFSYSLDALVGAASLLREAGAGTPLLGARTFADVFASVEDQEAVKLDLCVTALFLIPLLFIPNMISQSLDQVSIMHNNVTEHVLTMSPMQPPASKPPQPPGDYSHYTVTPLPPTPPAFWHPHRNLTSLPQQPIRLPAATSLPQQPIRVPAATSRTSRPTSRTTTTTTTAAPVTTPPRPSPAAVPGVGPATEETFSSDLWTDAASAAGGQPDITQVPGVIERQIQAVRERYQKMGVPRQYLTSKMIFKLIRGGGGQGFQFQY